MLKEHAEPNGTELGFHLTDAQCQSLREEAVQYYHRYLSLFVLEEFPGVVRDTAATFGCSICAASMPSRNRIGWCSSSTARTSP